MNHALANTLLRNARTAPTPRLVRGQQAVNPRLHTNIPTSGFFPDAGNFGLGGATLPSGSSPPDPVIGPTPSDSIDPPDLPQPPMAGGPPSGGTGGPQYNPQGPGLGGNFPWPSGVLPGGPITGWGTLPPTAGNAPPTVAPTFWGPGRGNNPYAGIPVPFDTQVTSNGPAGGGTTGEGGINHTFGTPFNVASNKAAGHDASYWVF